MYPIMDRNKIEAGLHRLVNHCVTELLKGNSNIVITRRDLLHFHLPVLDFAEVWESQTGAKIRSKYWLKRHSRIISVMNGKDLSYLVKIERFTGARNYQ